MPQRLRHRLILASLLLLSIALAACGSSSSEPRPEATQVAMEPSAASTTVNVTAKEFEYLLDTTEANAGAIRFVVQNAGAMPHDFVIQGNGIEQKTALLNPGQSTAIQVTLSPGTYTYICTVPGHELLGMRGTFTVS